MRTHTQRNIKDAIKKMKTRPENNTTKRETEKNEKKDEIEKKKEKREQIEKEAYKKNSETDRQTDTTTQNAVRPPDTVRQGSKQIIFKKNRTKKKD